MPPKSQRWERQARWDGEKARESVTPALGLWPSPSGRARQVGPREMGEKWRPELCVFASAREHCLGSFTFFDFYFSRSFGNQVPVFIYPSFPTHPLFSISGPLTAKVNAGINS